jgi:hypothetical protein
MMHRLKEAFFAPDRDTEESQEPHPIPLMRGMFWGVVFSSPIWFGIIWAVTR